MFGIILLTIACFCLSIGQQQNDVQEGYEEFENVNYADEKYFMVRDNASGGKTMRLVDPSGQRYTVVFFLCVWRIDLKKKAKITINNIRYSNNGPSDTVTVTIKPRWQKTQHLGEFNTTVGDNWNVLRNSGQIGKEVYVSRGGFSLLYIQVKTDKMGVEFDKISVTIENQNTTKRAKPICLTEFQDKELEAQKSD